MKKSSAPAQATEARGLGEDMPLPDLEFPIAPEFVSRPPRLDPQVTLARCAETMPWRNARPGESRRRLAEKIPVEFVL